MYVGIQELPSLGRTMVVGCRTNVQFGKNTHLLYLPEHVIKLASQRGRLSGADAEDYFFIAFNDFPWDRVADVVVGRPAYDNYLVGRAIQENVTVVDATATLLAFHQTGSDGKKAGFKNDDVDINPIRIGVFNYNSGLTVSAQCETRFIVDEICNRTRVVVKTRRRKHEITVRVSIPPTNRATTSEIPDSHRNN